MSRFVALRISSNSSHSSNPFRWLRQLHSLVLAGRYSRAPSLSASMFVNLPMYFSVHLTVRFEFTKLKVITGFFISLLFNFQGSMFILHNYDDFLLCIFTIQTSRFCCPNFIYYNTESDKSQVFFWKNLILFFISFNLCHILKITPLCHNMLYCKSCYAWY